MNLSNDLGKANTPVISSQGLNVYAAWTEGSKGVFFRMSSDGGNTWSPTLSSAALKLSNHGGSTAFPVMFAQYQYPNSGNVYIAWTQGTKQANGSMVTQIYVASSTNYGASFTTTQISHNSTNSQNTPALSAWGTDVYVSWFSANNATGYGSDYVSSSNNNGVTWGKPIDVVNPSGGGETEIVASGSSAYMVGDTILFTATYNSGASWSQQVNLYNQPYNSSSTSNYEGREPWIASYGNLVYVVWEANSTTPGISYHDQAVTSTDGGLTWGAIQNVTDPLKDSWEPENAAYGSNVFLTFHTVSSQGVYVTSATNVNSESPAWSTPVLLSPTKLKRLVLARVHLRWSECFRDVGPADIDRIIYLECVHCVQR